MKLIKYQDEKSGQSDYDMARMISKFRIDCEDVQQVDDLRHAKPSDAAVKKFEESVEELMTDDPDPEPWQVCVE